METERTGGTPPSGLEVRGARASSVIVQRYPAGGADRFMHWQHGITEAAAAFPGYQSTEIYPPVEGGEEWVVVIHFDDEQTLHGWLDSPVRNAWVEKLPRESRDFRMHTMPAGFGSWVASRPDDRLEHWKSFLLVLVGLYPVVMLLTLWVSPRTAGLGAAVSILVGNILSVSFLEWIGMPLLNRILGPWLAARGKDARLVSVAGALLIGASLVAMALFFRAVNG